MLEAMLFRTVASACCTWARVHCLFAASCARRFCSAFSIATAPASSLYSFTAASGDSRNFLADIKNWFFSAGSGFGGAIWDYLAKFLMEKFDETKGFIARLGDEQIGPRIDRMNSDVCGWLDTISGKLSGLKSAAGGAVSTATELVAVHGTPSNPEYIIPADKLAAMSGPRGGGGGATINVILNGTMVATSEFAKNGVFPAIIEAVKSGYRKAEFQAALGVA